MNIILKTGILGSILLSSVASATNPVYGPYFAVLAGIAYTPATDYSGPVILFPGLVGKLNYGTAFSGGLQLGYKIRNIRLELEGDYINAALSKLKINGVTIRNKSADLVALKGSNSLLSGFVNAIYEFYSPTSTWDFYPYAGLGIGYSKVRNNFKLQTGNVILLHLTESQSVTAGQGIIGVGYYMDDYTTFGLDYRYMTTAGIHVLNNQRLNIQSVNLVFNFAFGS